MHKLLLAFLLIVFGIVEITMANDLGKLGNTFKIEEEAFTLMMKRKLAEIDMEAEREKMQKIAIDKVENPVAVIGITGAGENGTFYFDPTYTLDEDAVLPCGKVLHKAGTTVNPLEHMDLNRRLFFC